MGHTQSEDYLAFRAYLIEVIREGLEGKTFTLVEGTIERIYKLFSALGLWNGKEIILQPH